MKRKASLLLIFVAVLGILLTQAHRVHVPGDELPAVLQENLVVAVLARDAIRPIYRPQFVSATAVRLDDDALVLGVVLDGHAKAYPVDILTVREMVNDELARIPILVTW